jgi:hypothetical protein
MPQRFSWTKAIEGAFIGGILSAFAMMQTYLASTTPITKNEIASSVIAVIVSFLIGAVRGLSATTGISQDQQEKLNSFASDIADLQKVIPSIISIKEEKDGTGRNTETSSQHP